MKNYNIDCPNPRRGSSQILKLAQEMSRSPLGMSVGPKGAETSVRHRRDTAWGCEPIKHEDVAIGRPLEEPPHPPSPQPSDNGSPQNDGRKPPQGRVTIQTNVAMIQVVDNFTFKELNAPVKFSRKDHLSASNWLMETARCSQLLTSTNHIPTCYHRWQPNVYSKDGAPGPKTCSCRTRAELAGLDR